MLTEHNNSIRPKWLAIRAQAVYFLHSPMPSFKISPDSQTVAAVWIVPKICQGHPQQCAHSVPDFIQIASL